MNITIENLRNVFTGATKFYVQNPTNKEDRFEISNLLFGARSFTCLELSFRDVSATGKDEITINFLDMPIEVYNAWKRLNQ